MRAMILNAIPQAQSVAQSRAQSEMILDALAPGPVSANELTTLINLQSKTGAFKRTMKYLLEEGLIEYTLSDKHNSRLQKYRLTEKGPLYLVHSNPPWFIPIHLVYFRPPL